MFGMWGKSCNFAMFLIKTYRLESSKNDIKHKHYSSRRGTSGRQEESILS